MKIVLQRTSNAKCINNGKTFSEISNGYVVFVGFQESDTKETLEWMVNKILSIKIFEDKKKSILDINGEILLLSQFTLFAEFSGTKPGFNKAAPNDIARIFFEIFVGKFKEKYCSEKIKTGVFGSKSEIEMTNDGPFTIILEK